MLKNNLLRNKNTVVRVLDSQKERVLIIDCKNLSMPKWIKKSDLLDFNNCTQEELQKETGVSLFDVKHLSSKRKRITHERYTMIAEILPFISDKSKRSNIISKIAVDKNLSKQTIRNYLCLYLAFQDVSVLAPNTNNEKDLLSQDEKNMRWALNKFYYTKNKNSLNTTYTLMLKEKYCDSCGQLMEKYPSFYQFRYFYRNHKKLQTYHISRNGLKNYQRNNRPLLGDGVQEFAPNIGVGMLDATVCDIYLVNESGNLIGRPILTACIDAYSGLCCGYSLSWEGGVYSLRNLMMNIITDKVKWCKQFGVSIKAEQWNCDSLPATFVTDMGSEYKSGTFEQITELGVSITNLPPYRPELKGSVEKFFDLIQNSFKPYLKGKGIIEPDYQERGAHDYRKDACLTMTDFEKIVLYCIIYYNNKRIIEKFPYTESMLEKKIKPYSSNIWEWGKSQIGANLIEITPKQLMLTLLPRTTGKFSRYGLKVNNLRYRHDEFTEMYLKGGDVTVAYNPDDVTKVWLLQNDDYVCFELIEKRFRDKDLIEVQSLQRKHKCIVKDEVEDNLQAKIDLAEHIQTIANNAYSYENVNIKEVRNTRKQEQKRTHINYLEGSAVSD